jgi:zinc transporter
MRAFLYSDGKAAELPFAEALAKCGEAELVWLHVDGREPEARAWIEAREDIPSLTRSALLATETRPRCDLIAQGALINLRGPGTTPDDDPDALVSVRFWAEPGRVISVSFRTSEALEPVVDRFLAGKLRDPGDLLTCWADAITETLDPDVTELGDSLDEIEPKMETGHPYTLRRKVSQIRGLAIAYRRFVVPQRLALQSLALAEVDWLESEDRLHLREAADRVARMAEELEAVRERSALIHEELTDLRAEQMDTRSLIISIVALIFLPLTFLTGLLGMNVDGIPYAHQPWAFWGVVGICVVLSLGVLGWFLRHSWIERN